MPPARAKTREALRGRVVDWTTFAVSAASTALGATLAIMATLLGNRYSAVLRVREAHHDDLRREALKPWRDRVRVLRNSLTPSLLRVWAVAREAGGTDVRSPMRRMEGEFPPSGLLWDRSREHWAGAHREWDAIEREEREITALVARAVADLKGDVEAWSTAVAATPPTGAAAEVVTRAAGLRARTTRFLDELERMDYDRNLEGRCEFCPREPPMARAFRWLVG